MDNEQLALVAKQGDGEALLTLWGQVKRLLYQLARKFCQRCGSDKCASHGVTLSDLEQECYLAFLDAVRAYRPAGGYKFTTYLTRASENRFRACMGTHHNALDIADSMNAPAMEDGESPVEAGDTIPDPAAETALDEIADRDEQYQYHVVLEEGMSKLDPVQSAILRRRYYGKQTRSQVAESLHITPADVRREESRALQALRGDRRVMALDQLEAAAYKGTGWNAWYYRQGSVEERLVERE